MIDRILKPIVKLVVNEFLLVIVLRIVNLGKSFCNIMISQAASSSEIQRLQGSESLVVSEFLNNNQSQILGIFDFVIFIVGLTMAYIAVKFIISMFEEMS